ncbi:High-affinity branched-chain amino acid transport system permease protein LivH [Paraburkholderia aspalathi]|uniref:urea ABC transporter permease subunit UrtB n=1 Tax=Paraburkholderia aspalathi TaxID=1324617 RepID=UPI001B1105D4|nr:urea ABC transporter permease subunit UrtB [Paraburkholderia aspalathi]CAE6844356.1 High-affinity branched-chain amino acid transport system permease protein LivH [Paraburkholderia aspalathi]
MTLDTFLTQVFNGLSLFTVLALMAIGLAIVFGLMGVINMAHGELMALGAYMTYLTSLVFARYLPSLMGAYFLVGIVVAFVVTGAVGFVLERSMIRFLYHRPLDTMLATWGLSLVLQQLYRQLFGPIDVSVPTVSWLQGAWNPTPGIAIPLSRIFIIGLTLAVALAVYLFLFRGRWGLRIRSVMQNRAMAGAAGINTERVDAVTFAVGCGLAGIAGSALTMLASTGPVTGQQYIVDTFIVVVFGGVESLVGTFLSAFSIGQLQSMFELVLSGSMAKAAILLLVIVALYFRPNGLFALKVRR